MVQRNANTVLRRPHSYLHPVDPSKGRMLIKFHRYSKQLDKFIKASLKNLNQIRCLLAEARQHMNNEMIEEVRNDSNNFILYEITDDNISTIFTLPDSKVQYQATGKKDNLKIDEINGAKTKENSKVEYITIGEEDIFSGCDKITLKFSTNDIYLGDIFNVTPYGLICKGKTGIGATTLELTTNRNSIIVFPTKTLAYQKAITGYVSDKYCYLYVGSEIGNSKDMPSIAEYLKDSTIRFKKILVVADSFRKVIDVISSNDRLFNSFHVMVDEIDTLQIDSTFRPALEDVIDYVFMFNPKNITLLSATINKFSRPEINNLPYIEMIFPNDKPRDINLFYTNNVNLLVKRKIEELYSDKQKIVIAYNSLTDILNVIEMLNESIKKNVGIFCSEVNRDKVEKYFSELSDQKLVKDITFMTCSFFVGIDIKEQHHLINVSNIAKKYSLLSPNTIKQIAGRCRDPKGLLSENVIYNAKPLKREFRINNKLRNDLICQTKKAIDCYKILEYMSRTYTKYVGSEVYNELIDNLLNRECNNSYMGGSTVKLTRFNIYNELVPAYFNIDSIYEGARVRVNIYKQRKILRWVLSKTENVTYREVIYKDVAKEQEDAEVTVDRIFDDANKDSLDRIKQELKKFNEDNSFNSKEFKNFIRNKNRSDRSFIDIFISLKQYITIDDLLEILSTIHGKNEKCFRGVNNGLLFWALDGKHSFKVKLKQEFKLGIVYTKDEIGEKMRHLYNYHFKRICDQSVASRVLGEFIEIERTNSRDSSYKIVSYNKFNLKGKPLSKINESLNISDGKSFMFSSRTKRTL